jgi:hypothetical protein
MSEHLDELSEDILRSEEAAGWQARLTAAFFDGEVKRAIVNEVRESIASKTPEGPEKSDALLQPILRRLIGVASRDARSPGREVSMPVETLISGPDLEDRIIDQYPYPIATPFRALVRRKSAAGAFGCLLDTFEGLVHFLATVTVSAYLRGGLANKECNSHLLQRLVKDLWATGDLMALLRDTVRLAGHCEGRLP